MTQAEPVVCWVWCCLVPAQQRPAPLPMSYLSLASCCLQVSNQPAERHCPLAPLGGACSRARRVPTALTRAWGPCCGGQGAAAPPAGRNSCNKWRVQPSRRMGWVMPVAGTCLEHQLQNDSNRSEPRSSTRRARSIQVHKWIPTAAHTCAPRAHRQVAGLRGDQQRRTALLVQQRRGRAAVEQLAGDELVTLLCGAGAVRANAARRSWAS